jgi:hypothetical protein
MQKIPDEEDIIHDHKLLSYVERPKDKHLQSSIPNMTDTMHTPVLARPDQANQVGIYLGP